ncbi:MATE family efflux transporter [Deinococcus roseus]|uniref:Multidrug export protein MepA n=1 Tax=Deinococcus roseus TaxID=392414 RepID=A0ABQ2DBK9_9DEIO|nr:MATE family efflux transporter [Deinococcus roseus]GGJ52476.1 MATE family efflux transporter [Deinococcus roseus]
MKTPSGVERLGTASIGRLLLEMSTQTTFALLVYAIYTITDVYFLSKGVGPLAAAGASIIAPVLIALGAVSTTVGAGGASVVSRALGAKDTERASRAVAASHLIFWTAALTLTVLGATFIRPLVFLLGATDAIAPYAIEYGRIIFLGALTSTGFSAIIRADGSARYATLIWVVPVTMNVVLCWLFIMVLHLGAAGAALATVCGQAVSAGMGMHFFFFRKNRSYQIRSKHFRPHWQTLKEILLVGLPSLTRNLSASVLAIVVNNLLKGMGGDSALSIFAVVNRLYVALSIPQMGIVQAMQPIVGFNFGQRKQDRVQQTIKVSILTTVGYGLLICALCTLVPASLISLLSRDTEVIASGSSALRWMALACPVAGVSMVAAAVFQSLGLPAKALWLTIGGIVMVKLPVLLLSAHFFSLTGIWVAEGISEVLLCGVALVMLGRSRGPRAEK